MELVFRLACTERRDLYRTRDVMMSTLRSALPREFSHKDIHMMAAGRP